MSDDGFDLEEERLERAQRRHADRLKDIQERLEVTSAGPWYAERTPTGTPCVTTIESSCGGPIHSMVAHDLDWEDAVFVAHSPDDVKYLLGTVERLSALVSGGYFEAHVTVEPVFGERLGLMKEICRQHRFKVADLFMQRDREATPERSSRDTFCTGHGKFEEPLAARMELLVGHLRNAGFVVWREKLEHVRRDQRFTKE